MEKTTHYTYLFTFILLFTACSDDSFTSVVEVDIPDLGDKLVVNCIFQPDTGFIVNVSKSVSILDNEDVRDISIDNASIELYEDGQLLTNEFIYQNMPNIYDDEVMRYYANINPEVGKEYRIKVSAPDFEPVEAVAQIPLPLPSLNVYISDSNHYDSINEEEFLEVTIEFQDNGSIDNYYFLNLHVTNTAEVVLVDATGAPILDENGDLIYVTEQRRSPYYMRTYDLSFEKIEAFDDLDPEDSGRVFLGNDINTFNDELFNGNNKEILVYIDKWNLEHFDQLIFQLGSIDRSYYLYHRSRILQYDVDDNPFAEPILIHNNIENGFGIFTGFTSIEKIIE